MEKENNQKERKIPSGIIISVVGLVIMLLIMGTAIFTSIILGMFGGFDISPLMIVIALIAFLVLYSFSIVGLLKMKNWGKTLTIIVFVLALIWTFFANMLALLFVIIIHGPVVLYLLFNEKIKEVFN